jgi:hypothetical protein
MKVILWIREDGRTEARYEHPDGTVGVSCYASVKRATRAIERLRKPQGNGEFYMFCAGVCALVLVLGYNLWRM